MDNRLNIVKEERDKMREPAFVRQRSPVHKNQSPPRKPNKRDVSKAKAKDLAALRVNFNESLARVYNPGTMETGMTDCHMMIKDNCDD